MSPDAVDQSEVILIDSRTHAQIVDHKIQESGVMARLGQMEMRKRRAYFRGQSARENGWVRVSPFYEDDGADMAWFAGYDGEPEPTMDAILVPVLA